MDNLDENIVITGVGEVNNTVIGEYTITYNVTDSNGNEATEVTRTVNVVDTTAPVITLIGHDVITLEVNS